MYFASPLDYDRVMKRVPSGKLTTVGAIREYFARSNNADFTEPITAGIFVSIAAWASHQRDHDETPYWRTLKAKGERVPVALKLRTDRGGSREELNPKYPGGVEAQRAKLEAEGHRVVERGRKNLRYYVEGYEQALFDLEGEE